MCEAMYIGKTQQTLKKRMDGHFSNLLRLLKNGQKPYSFAAHFKNNFNATTSHKDLFKYMTFKEVNQINLPSCNLYTEERLTTLKNIRDKCVTVMNKNSETYGA